MRHALEAVGSVRPQLVSVQVAEQAIPRMRDGVVFHAGPPIEPSQMCEPMRAAIAVGLKLEGVVVELREALRLLDAGEIELIPNHDAGCVGPMAGILTSSMPVWTVASRGGSAHAWSSLNEGSGAVLRYGADTPEVADRLRWMRDDLAPGLTRALDACGPVDLLELMADALAAGDELHHRTHAATRLLTQRLAPELASPHARFLAENHQTFLNVAMAASKLCLDAAPQIEGCALVTAIARNGVQVGVRLAGTGDRWFTGPAPLPDPVTLHPGFAPSDMCRDLGDSAIVEAYGLGAIAVSAAPSVGPSVGLPASGAIDRTDQLRPIFAGHHPDLEIPGHDGPRPAALGLDAHAIVELEIVPPIHTGIAHRKAGIGQIGGGVSRPPLEAFRAALDALVPMHNPPTKEL